jgi:hypothetical protein
MTDRLQCAIPFCRRTTPRRGCAEWICGDHWRLIDPIHRRVYGRRRGRWRRYAPEDDQNRVNALWRLWCFLKRRATERAAGIAA